LRVDGRAKSGNREWTLINANFEKENEGNEEYKGAPQIEDPPSSDFGAAIEDEPQKDEIGLGIYSFCCCDLG
jgi:hypothetical protein